MASRNVRTAAWATSRAPAPSRERGPVGQRAARPAGDHESRE
ncbi:hypothetical protein ACFRH6_23940 [Streptomyces sp. NPDC056749]